MCIINVVCFIILLLNIFIFLNDEKTVLSHPITMIKDYFLFNKDLVYEKYTNIRKFYTIYGFDITIKVMLVKGIIISLLTYIWLLLINISLLFDSILSFTIITGFYFTLVSQITCLGIRDYRDVNEFKKPNYMKQTSFDSFIKNVKRMNKHITISEGSKITWVYEEWINNKVWGLLIDNFEKYFSIDLYDEKYYDLILGSYTYIIMYPFRLLDFLIYYILHDEFSWEDILFVNSKDPTIPDSGMYEVPGLSYNFFEKSYKEVIKRLFNVGFLLFVIHIIFTIFVCLLTNVDYSYYDIFWLLIFRGVLKSNSCYLSAALPPWIAQVKNHTLYRGTVPLWTTKHSHYMFKSGTNLYTFTHSTNFDKNVFVGRPNLTGKDKKQFINLITLDNYTTFKKMKEINEPVWRRRAILFAKEYYSIKKDNKK